VTEMNRRKFLHTTAAIAVSQLLTERSFAEVQSERKFRMNLNVGQVGVKATPFEAIKLARQYGYESVTPMHWAMAKYSPERLEQLVAEMKENGLVWGAVGLRPFFHRDSGKFKDRLAEIRRTAELYQRAGVMRCFTWTMSSSDSLTYRQNFRLHVQRIREAGKILAEHGVRLGIEYLGTRQLAIRNKFPFIRTSAEAKELTAEIGLRNVGIALDSWHWFQAGETEQDIVKLTNQDVVTADICDAPAGVDPKQMPDSPRRLPCTTGAIDVGAFLRGLVKIGYDGPVGTEPFDKSLRKMSTQEAMKTATAAMNKAFALIE